MIPDDLNILTFQILRYEQHSQLPASRTHYNWRNELSFVNKYSIVVHNIPIVKAVDMNMVFDEMWYIVEYLFINIVSLFIVFDWKKNKTIIISIHHVLIVNNHR